MVLLALGVGAWASRSEPGLIVFIAAFALWWILAALAQFAEQLALTDDTIQMRGYIGQPKVIAKSDVTSCRYIRLRPEGRRGIDMFFVEVRGTGGRAIKIWRYGWGRQHHQLFKNFAAWIAQCPVEFDDRTASFIKSAS